MKQVSLAMKVEKYKITGMSCAACQANVTRCVQKLAGVQDVDVSLLSNRCAFVMMKKSCKQRRLWKRCKVLVMARPPWCKRKRKGAAFVASGSSGRSRRRKSGAV